jgi:hypothetical protein
MNNNISINHGEPYPTQPDPTQTPSNYVQPQAPSQTQVGGNVYPPGPAGFSQAPTQTQVPVQPLTTPAIAQNDKYTTYRTTLQADINVPKDGEKTLSWVHRNQKKASLITTVIVILLSGLNVFYTFHIISIRHKNKAAYLAAESLLNPKNVAQQAADQVKHDNGPDIENRPDGTLDMSHKISASFGSTPSNQDIKTTGLNQQINLYNGLSMMITSVQKNPPLPQSIVDELKYTPLDSGYGYVRVNMIIGNRNQNYSAYVSLVGLTANVNGAVVKNIVEITGYDSVNPFGSSTDLTGDIHIDSNKTLSGSFFIKVPLNPLPTITYEDDSNFGPNNNSRSLIGEFKLQ